MAGRPGLRTAQEKKKRTHSVGLLVLVYVRMCTGLAQDVLRLDVHPLLPCVPALPLRQAEHGHAFVLVRGHEPLRALHQPKAHAALHARIGHRVMLAHWHRC